MTRTQLPGRGATEHPAPGVARTRLPGGPQVLTEHVAGSRSVSIGIWIDVGSRHEAAPAHGAAHFLEHLLFKGTARRSARQIAEEIDAVGGDLNAFTTKEHTCFYAHVLDTDLALAADILCDVVLEARMDVADVDVERDVVLSEIDGRDDDPEDVLADDFDELVFPGHPLALPVIGHEDSIKAMTQGTLAGFHATHYRPERMVVAAAGNVRHDDVVAAVERGFAEHGGTTAPLAGTVAPPETLRRGLLTVHDVDSEQVHVMVGGQGVARGDPRWETQVLLSTILGGGTSSRLFQTIRERRGLAYSVYSTASGWTDAGTLSAYVGCAPERLPVVASLLREEIDAIAEHGVTGVELARAQGQLRGETVLALEDVSARMSRLGRRGLAPGAPFDVDESLRRIAAVTVDDVDDLAEAVLGGPRAVAVVGPYEDDDEPPAELKELMGP